MPEQHRVFINIGIICENGRCKTFLQILDLFFRILNSVILVCTFNLDESNTHIVCNA